MVFGYLFYTVLGVFFFNWFFSRLGIWSLLFQWIKLALLIYLLRSHWWFPNGWRIGIMSSSLVLSLRLCLLPLVASLCFLSAELQGPFLCLYNLFPEPTQPSWLTSSTARFYLCDFLSKLLLYLKKKKKNWNTSIQDGSFKEGPPKKNSLGWFWWWMIFFVCSLNLCRNVCNESPTILC